MNVIVTALWITAITLSTRADSKGLITRLKSLNEKPMGFMIYGTLL